MCVCVCVFDRGWYAPPYSTYIGRSGLPRTRVHRPQYGGGFVHPVVQTGLCRWWAWGFGLSPHRAPGSAGPSSRTRDRCTVWVGEGKGSGIWGGGSWVAVFVRRSPVIVVRSSP